MTANLDKNPAAAALPTKLEFKFERYQPALVSGMTHLTLTSSDLDDKTAKNFKKLMEYYAPTYPTQTPCAGENRETQSQKLLATQDV